MRLWPRRKKRLTQQQVDIATWILAAREDQKRLPWERRVPDTIRITNQGITALHRQGRHE